MSTLTSDDPGRRRWLTRGAAWLTCAGTGSIAGLGAAGAQTESLPRGQVTPDFALDGLDGMVTSNQLRGQVVYLDFWASWCAPCRQSFPWMNELQARHREQGLRVVAINLDRQRAAAEAFLREQPARFTVLFDPQGDTPRSHRVMGMPTSMLLDAEGRLLSRHIGFRADDRELLEGRVREALANKAAGRRTAS